MTDTKEPMETGQILLEEQIKICTNPHLYEGLVYVNDSDEAYMFCQVSWHKFDMINLDTGNRTTMSGVQMKCKEHPHGRSPAGTLKRISQECEQSLTCAGKFNDLLGLCVGKLNDLLQQRYKA